MGAWTFVAVYLAVFVLLQLAVYRYLRNRDDENPGLAFAGPPSSDRGPGSDTEAADRGARRETADRDGPFRRCPSCGETNDPDGPYTFCRNCASRLPG